MVGQWAEQRVGDDVIGPNTRANKSGGIALPGDMPVCFESSINVRSRALMPPKRKLEKHG